MSKYKQIGALTVACLLISTPALADWQVKKNADFVGGGYHVYDPDTGRSMNTKFNTKKGAKAAAKALNEADKLAEENNNK